MKPDKSILEDTLKYAHLNLGDVSKLDVVGPFQESIFLGDEHNPPQTLIATLRNPRYLGWVCKHILNKETLPFQNAILYDLWTHTFPMLIETRGGGKTFILALYAILRALLCPRSKIVIVGSAFRQSKAMFDYIVDVWTNSDILRDICGNDGRQGPHIEPDKCTMVIGESTIIAIPLGDGTRIRGLRANYILADEFASIPRAIFENVVIGFAAVSGNPVENVKEFAKRKLMESMGLKCLYDDEFKAHNNQTVISGTAYYSFNHFHEYWLQYKKIILSKGDKNKLLAIFPEGVPNKFDHKDFTIIRIPYERLPEGFMDDKHVGKAKATTNSSSYLCEYGAVFPTDSNGFFRRTLIEACVSNDKNEIELPSGLVNFTARLRGDKNKKYVFGVDPASEQDNFSIVVLECHADHRRIVYVWTTTKTHYKNMLKSGITNQDNFYGFVARKIRDLMKIFPCEAIALDTQGGGVAVEEALHSFQNMEPGEQPLWPVIIEDKEQDTDDKHGLHILHKINFADSNWTKESNHGMRKDFEDRTLLFPAFDTITIALSIEEDKRNVTKMDTLEDCVLEIEELKDELATIVHTQTANSGRDKWDTPEVKLPGGKKGRQRKDRYSALLMANAVARKIAMADKPMEHNFRGGFINTIEKNQSGPKFQGPAWYKFPV